jgi:hypothetical protein
MRCFQDAYFRRCEYTDLFLCRDERWRDKY